MIRIAGTSTIDLRNPEFGDVLKMDHNSIVRHTRTGELKYYRDTLWPRVTSLAFTFVDIKEALMQDFRDLMISDAGLQFTISRREGATTMWTYDGFIITPIFDIIRKRPPCSYDFNFEFQVKVTTP